MQRPLEEKASKLTLRDLVLTGYLQEVSRGHSKLGNELGKPQRTHEQTKDRMLELGKIISELIEAKKKAETRKRTTCQRISRKLKVKGKRSLAAIRRNDGTTLNTVKLKVHAGKDSEQPKH